MIDRNEIKNTIKEIIDEVHEGTRVLKGPTPVPTNMPIEEYLNSSIEFISSVPLVKAEAEVSLEIADELESILKTKSQTSKFYRVNREIIRQLRSGAKSNLKYVEEHFRGH